LAAALSLEPKLLFLDEPTAGLDPISAAAFDELLLYLHSQLRLTVVMITHDLDTLFRTCTRVGVIVDGRMTAGTLDDLMRNQDPWIRDYFTGPGAGGEPRRLRKGDAWIGMRITWPVGAFVLLVTAMALSFVLWYRISTKKRIYLRYEIYFQGSVSGLHPGQPGALPGSRRRARCRAS